MPPKCRRRSREKYSLSIFQVSSNRARCKVISILKKSRKGEVITLSEAAHGLDAFLQSFLQDKWVTGEAVSSSGGVKQWPCQRETQGGRTEAKRAIPCRGTAVYSRRGETGEENCGRNWMPAQPG
ncbi:hypothetical protein AGOR_G00248160 [Albula goreensis]|uniref:Uncharacterized protein n=1 Tax=Albula goreensis TaxID=1534307 RepID=A0A8T3CFW2_9TELE|nr:hypothetical protein AGOR_G00248160 [Albula goreensis]